MKKALTLILVFLLVVASSLFVFVGCKKGEEDSPIPEHEHFYVPTVTEPTCTEQGYTTYKCPCGNEYTDNVTAAKGHDYATEWTIDTAATCTSEGTKSHHCKNCNAKTDVTAVPKTEHDYATEWTLDVLPTCTAEGEKSHHCTNCSAKTDVTAVPKTVHDYAVDWTLDVLPTCTAEGEKSHHCKNCSAKTDVTAVPKTVHDYATEWTVDVQPTCVKKGEKSHHCKNCSAKTDVTEVDALGHKYEGGVCTGCGEKEIEEATGLEYTLSEDGSYYIVTGLGTETRTEFKIPSTYNGKPVKEIGEYAFSQIEAADPQDITQIRQIILPDSIVSIGEYAFVGCMYLNQIVIPDSVENIGERAFCFCYGLASVTIGSKVKEIDNTVFMYCVKLVEVINKSKIEIKPYCWGEESDDSSYYYPLTVKSSGESSLVEYNDFVFFTHDNVNYLLGYTGQSKSVVLPESYNGEKYAVYNFAFVGEMNIESVTISRGVTSIGASAFWYCNSLISVTIGNGVTSIGSQAFAYCYDLTSITIGNSVTSIGSQAFYYCSSLTFD